MFSNTAGAQVIELRNCALVDAVHGSQLLHSEAPAQTGLPGLLTADFDFQLTPGTVLPPRGLAVAWQILDSSGVPVSTKSFEDSGTGVLSSITWSMDADAPMVSVLAYNMLTGVGEGRVDLPVGRLAPASLFPPLLSGTSQIDLRFGLQGEFQCDPLAGPIQGELFHSVDSFLLERPKVLVDIERPESVGGEVLKAAISVLQPSSVDRTLTIECTVQGLLIGLPGSITIPAGQTNKIIRYAPLVEGSYQIRIFELGQLVGYSTYATISGRNEFPIEAIAASGPMGSATGPCLNDLQSPIVESSLPLIGFESSAYPFEPDGFSNPWTGTKYEWFCACNSKPYAQALGDVCGECYLAPLSQGQKMDCLPIAGLYLPYRCQARTYAEGALGHPTSCSVRTKTMLLDTYQLFAYGNQDCFALEVSGGGPLWSVTLGKEFEKSCCTYQRLEGSSAMYEVPDCITLGEVLGA